MKRLTVTMILAVFISMVPIQAFAASSQSGQYYPPSDSEYFKKKFSWQFYIDHQTYQIRFTSRPLDPNNPLFLQQTFDVRPNSFIWFDFSCQGRDDIEFLDAQGNVLSFMTRGQTTTYLDGTGDVMCVRLSDFDENAKDYVDTGKQPDGLGGNGGNGTEGNPPNGGNGGGNQPPDGGSGPGGDGGSGGDGSDPGGDGGGGTDPGGGGTDPEENPPPKACDPECRIFRCPQWDDYMGKIDNIANKIPPPPNWPEVADTFRDSIVPKLVDDIGDLLGTAPNPPAPAPELPGLDDRGIKGKEPEMKDVPGLEDSGFDANKIKNEAPKIPEREDPTGGFDLSTNPVDALPDAPENPKPGETDAGEWGKNKPKEEDNPFPYPKDKGDPDVGSQPKPGDNGATPPSPGGDPGSAPKPGGDLGNGPSPGGSGGDPNMLDYKPSPGAPDGSGGDLK